ncbi:MAG: redoxin domain-containing protein [Candidatus Aminicenantes bacterium]|nr:redoxin domain-containing protein [Candidatus Aminicenantes bacterium]NIM81143.1 redoxin domain-containing protein [Candidatus Aminicenantes bacterium]NIN20517.1 redoxin domain-containing protein [Candidatus Aminicenantes bacterium]NIN44290.1 redoxin domain-containing protein [Candidatus Aminicenantes bacterium]NIN87109.1 redoxin domain-containing protein [Candidatus Aminicenantes bacterium]
MKSLKPFLLIGLLVLCFVGSGSLEAVAANTNEKTKVEKIGKAELESIFASQKGRVLLVNVWATWCKPCREEFPDLVRLARFFKNKDVRIITISADYPDEIETKILPFLNKFKINFPVYVQDFPRQEDFINRMNKKWNGALPATFVYDKTGRQQAFLLGKKDFETLKKEIEKIGRSSLP